MMDKSSDLAKQIATNTFSAQAASLSGAEVSKLIITVTDSANINIGRTATVRYTAKSNNIFAGILGMRALTISGSSTSNAAKAPFIDFYLLLDTSPSMLLPSTSAGLRSEDRRDGKEGVMTCRSRWFPYH